MIRITKGDGYITIEGHAGYAEHGRDIVCAGVTALVEMLIKSIEELTPNSAGYTAEPGLVRLRIGSPTEDTKLLVRAFFIGAENIAEQFPDNVQVSGTE